MTGALLALLLALPASAEGLPAAPPLLYDGDLLIPADLRDAAGSITPPEERDTPSAPEQRRGWVATTSSLLLYDSSGTLVSEIGLGQWEEDGPDGTLRRRLVRGGASKDGRFAWAWEKADSIRSGRADKVVSSIRLLRYLGTDGSELFRNELADAPKGLDPAVSADNGETVLVAERGLDAWIVAAYYFTGSRLAEAYGKGSIELLRLSPNGHFGLIRWHQLDRPPVYTLFNLEKRVAKDLPALKTGALEPTIADDGTIYAGGKPIHSP